MSMMSAIPGVSALAASLGGLALIVRAWQRRRQAHRRLLATGWSLLALAPLIWAAVMPPVYAATLGVLALCLTATAVITLRAGWLHRPVALELPPRNTSTPARAWRTGLRGFAVTMLTGPIALIAALTLSLGSFALARVAGWHDADQLALALFAVPLIWAGLATFAVIDLPLRWRSSFIVTPAVIAGGLLLLVR